MTFKVVSQKFREKVPDNSLGRLANVDLAIENIAVILVSLLVCLLLHVDVHNPSSHFFQRPESQVQNKVAIGVFKAFQREVADVQRIRHRLR